MPTVTNLGKRTVVVLDWRILPDGSRCVDKHGKVHENVPDDIAYSVQVKRLVDQNILAIEGLAPAKSGVVDAPRTEPQRATEETRQDNNSIRRKNRRDGARVAAGEQPKETPEEK